MKKQFWIDIAKCIAILGVLVDHLYGLYSNYQIAWASFYSVSLFILIMGICTYLSFDNSKVPLYKKVIKRELGIFIPYAFSTVVYSVTIYQGEFNLSFTIEWLLKFGMSSPHYYVLLYMQLLLACPVFYYVINKLKGSRLCVLGNIAQAGGVLLLCIWTTNHTNLLDVYGGGGRLFGGNYLFLLYIGMLFGSNYDKIMSFAEKNIVKVAGAVISLLCAICIWRYNCTYGYAIDSKLPFGDGGNPPSLQLSVYAIAVMFVCLFVTKIAEGIRFKPLQMLMTVPEYLGQHTLYIFLYHRLFMDFILSRITFSNIHWQRISYLVLIIAGPLLIEKLLKPAREFIKKAYGYCSADRTDTAAN